MKQQETNTQQLMESIHLSEKEILEKFSFTLNGDVLSYQEAVQFIELIKKEINH